jgi:hypothetical protein
MSRTRSKANVYLLVATLLVGLGPSTRAEKPRVEDAKAQRMDFDDDNVTGDVVTPDGVRADSVLKRPHTSLIKVRANFIAELVASTENL